MSSTTAKLVIGIPSISRAHAYLEGTVSSVLAGVHPGADVELVVLNADDPPERHAAVPRMARAHPNVVVIDNRAGHRDLDALTATADTPVYRRWATKLVLDCALVMEACAARGDLYLHLEDDIIAAPEWFARFAHWQQAHFPLDGHWRMLCLYHPHPWPDRSAYPLDQMHGSLGLLFRTRELPALVAYLRRRCAEGPLDWLIRDHLIETRGSAFVRTPSLFQHVGVISSWSEHVQLIEAPTFEERFWPRHARLASDVGHLLFSKPRRAFGVLRARLLKRRPKR